MKAGSYLSGHEISTCLSTHCFNYCTPVTFFINIIHFCGAARFNKDQMSEFSCENETNLFVSQYLHVSD